MMDGGVSHLSKKVQQRSQRRNCKIQDSLKSARMLLSLISHFISVLYWLSYCSTSGTSSPKWVQPAAEGGGLFGICIRVNFLALRDLFSLLCLFCFCLHSQHG
jgi:hypothetical protein